MKIEHFRSRIFVRIFIGSFKLSQFQHKMKYKRLRVAFLSRNSHTTQLICAPTALLPFMENLVRMENSLKCDDRAHSVNESKQASKQIQSEYECMWKLDFRFS